MARTRQEFIDHYRGFRVDVPEGHHYAWEVCRHTIDEQSMAMHNSLSPETGRFTEVGTFTNLRKYGRWGNPYNVDIVMSDHLCEIADHQALVDYCIEHAPVQSVLINGLGLGVAIELLAPYVEQFTIVELSRSVIHLVAPHYQTRYPGRIEIIHADAFKYRPARHYDAVFHDVWTPISEDNLPEMDRLEKRYAPFCDWQASWAREYCEQLALSSGDRLKHFLENTMGYKNVHIGGGFS